MPAAIDGGYTLLGSVTSGGGTSMVLSSINTSGYTNFILTTRNLGCTQGSSDLGLYFNSTQSGYGYTRYYLVSGTIDTSGAANQAGLLDNGQFEAGSSGVISNTRMRFGYNATNNRITGLTDKSQVWDGGVRQQGQTIFSVNLSGPITSITFYSQSSRNFATGGVMSLWGLV